MVVLFIISAKDMRDPEYGFTAFGPVGGVFVIGVGMLALGVPLMIACAVRFRAFFRGETLNEDTPILVPDAGGAGRSTRVDRCERRKIADPSAIARAVKTRALRGARRSRVRGIVVAGPDR